MLTQQGTQLKNEKLVLFSLALIQFTHIMDFMIMMPLGPQLMRIFEITPAQFGLIVSAYTFSAGIFGFLGAFFIDRFDRKAALLFIYSGFIIGTLACAVAPTYHWLLAARVFTGMFGGVAGALILSIIGDAIPNERRASAMGIVMAAFSLASVFGVPFGLYMANKFSWHAPFLFIGCIGFAIIALISFVIPSMRNHIVAKLDRPGPLKVITNVTTNPNQLRALLLMFLLMLGQFSVIPFLSPYMVANVGFTEADLTYIYLIGGFVTIFSSPMVGRLADKIGRFKVFTLFVIISLIPLFGITNMPKVEMPYVLVITSIFFICAGGRMIPASTMVTSSVLPKQRGSFMSINSSVQQLSASLAAFIAGLIVQKNAAGELVNYNYVGYIAIAASLLAILVASKIKVVDEVKPKTV
ncbi:MAG: MFS transporter [Bacteroidota bacterium]